MNFRLLKPAILFALAGVLLIPSAKGQLPSKPLKEWKSMSRAERKYRRWFADLMDLLLHSNIYRYTAWSTWEVPREVYTDSSGRVKPYVVNGLMPKGVGYVWELYQALELQPGDTFVDFGCSVAWMEASMMTYGMDSVTVYGIDIDGASLQVAPRVLQWTQEFIDYYNAGMNVLDPSLAHSLPVSDTVEFIPVQVQQGESGLRPGITDKLICVQTLHHLDQQSVHAMASLVRPGGKLFILEDVAKKPHTKKCGDDQGPAYRLSYDEILALLSREGFSYTGGTQEEFGRGRGLYIFTKHPPAQ